MTTGRKSTVLAAGLALLAVGLASAVEAKTLTFCPQGSPEGFDPAPFTLGTTFDASSQAIYDRLVTFKPGTTEIAPGLATSWDVSSNGLEYTFHLRPGVTFQTTAGFAPTREFNADDVVFSLERQWDPDNPYFDYAGGLWPTFNGMAMPTMLRSVKKQDDQTVVVTLNRPAASLLANLAMDFASILSAEYAATLLDAGEREKLNTEPVGTGPFVLDGYEEGIFVRYAANPDYWGGRPAIDDLVFEITPDAGVRLAKLEAGDCDVIPDPPLADIAALPDESSISIVEVPGANVVYLAFNTLRAPFDQAAVRRALAKAIDKQAIVDAVFHGAAIPATTPIPPSVWGHADALAGNGHDPEAARAMLAEAGAAGLSLRIVVPNMGLSFNPDAELMAGMIATDLDAVGVKATVVTETLDAVLEDAGNPERDAAVLFGWSSDNGDPGTVFSILLGCDAVGITNLANWCVPRFDTLIRDAEAQSSREARAAAYKQAQAIFVDEAPWAALAHGMETVGLSDQVKGFVVDPLGRFRFATVDVAEE